MNIRLTDREKDVLKLIVDGKKNREIAGILYLSLNTVKTHIKNISLRLGASGRVEIVRIAIFQNLVDINSLSQ